MTGPVSLWLLDMVACLRSLATNSHIDSKPPCFSKLL